MLPSENPVSMPDKPKPTMYLDHQDHPEAKDMMPGDSGVMHVHYKVKSHRREDDGHGETQVEIHKIEHDGKPKKKKNAANMPIDELKEVIKSSEKPNDQSNS